MGFSQPILFLFLPIALHYICPIESAYTNRPTINVLQVPVESQLNLLEPNTLYRALSQNSTVRLKEDDFRQGNTNYEVHFECLSNQPVEWIFERQLYSGLDVRDCISVKAIRLDNLEDQAKSGTNGNVFVSKLQFSRFEPSNSGNFVCREIHNSNSNVRVYISFNTIEVDETIFYFSTNNEYSIDIGMETKIATIPIYSRTSMLVEISLNKFKNDNGDDVFSEIQAFKYDNREGLSINLSVMEDPLGEYSVAQIGTPVDIRFQLTSAINENFRWYPPTSHVDHNTSESIHFQCESKSAMISLPWPSISKASQNPKTPFKANDEFPRKVTLTLNPSDYNYGDKLQCINDSNQVSIHTWYFTTSKPALTKLSYNPVTKSHSCCTNSPFWPEINSIPCNHPSLCLISTYQRILPDNPYGPGNGIGTEVKNQTGEVCANILVNESIEGGHLVTCTVNNTMEFRAYTLDILGHTVEYYWERSVPPDVYLKIEVEPKSNGSYEIGNYATFTCQADSFYFASNLGLAVVYRNGTVKERNHLEIVASTNNILKQSALIQLDSADIVQVACYAPRLDSFEWLTVSLTVTVNGNKLESGNKSSGEFPLVTVVAIVAFALVFLVLLLSFVLFRLYSNTLRLWRVFPNTSKRTYS